MIEIEEGTTKVLYSPLGYTLATEEAERIGVDHIARVSVAGSKESSAGIHQLILRISFLYLRCLKVIYSKKRKNKTNTFIH